jgi:hypothetical protein
MGMGYPENALVGNRAAVLLWGGSEEDRRAWAEEASSQHGAGPLRTAGEDVELQQALADARGVVFVPNVSTLSDATQRALVLCLREQEERPKLVLSLNTQRQTALDRGELRPDLDYALLQGRVDLADPSVRQAIQSRRGSVSRRPSHASAKKGKAKRRK